jgi:UDP-glucose 4-epimerase
MHEVLVSEEECLHTWRRGAFYVIRAMLPELGAGDAADGDPLGQELSSADAVLELPAVDALLRNNALLVEQVASGNGSAFNGEELLR